MRHYRVVLIGLVLLGSLGVMAMTDRLGAEDAVKQASEPTAPATGTVTLYCGRSATLVEPLLRQFTEQTGIRVQLKAAPTPQLALALAEEGDRSPADVFWAQDVGTLGALAKRGMFEPLPEATLAKLPASDRDSEGRWVGTSGRLRVLAYAPQRVSEDQLPASVFDLTDAKWKGRVAWAPTNASFQAFVTAMRHAHGQDKARQWLIDMKANGARPYANNTSVIMGLANGEADLGLTNHYYLLRFKVADEKYPVEQTLLAAGDIGNLNNLAGAAVLRTSRNKDAAIALIDFLLSDVAQQYFVGETFELPVTRGAISPKRMLDPDEVRDKLPKIDLSELDDLDGTLELLREVGLN